MQLDHMIFQLATHYLPKIALRLEGLFLSIEQACQETHPIIHHYALKNIIEIIKLIEKPELKSRFIKELMRIEHSLNKIQSDIPNALYAKLFVQVQVLHHIAGRFGETIHQNTFLQAIRLAQSSHHHDCESHDAPQLLLWLEYHATQRQNDLASWLKNLQSLYDTVTIYLSLLRNTADFKTIDMFNGFYQRSLPAQTCQLILLRMDINCGLVPKMQLGHHGLSLRLCEANSMQEIHHANITVDLAICQL